MQLIARSLIQMVERGPRSLFQ
jgi:hypothetical protein